MDSGDRARLGAAAAAGLLAAALVLLGQAEYGAGLRPDSLNYVSTARSLLAGEGLVNARGGLYASWPPLYPLLLAAAGGVAGRDPLEVAGALNALLLGLTVFFAARHLLRRLESRWLAAWVCAALALSPPLVEAASWALSEPLFLLAATLALIDADKLLSGGGGRRRLLAAAAWSAAAWLTRYIGVAVAGFVGLLVLLRAGVPARRKAREGAVFALAAGLLPALWMLRNYLLAGALTGGRDHFDCPLPQVLGEVGAGLWAWARFEPEWAALGAAALGGAAAIALAAARGAGRGGPRTGPLRVWGGFAAVYLLLFVGAMTWGVVYPTVRPRFLAPLYIPLLAAAALAAGPRLAAQPRRVKTAARRFAVAAAAAAALVWLSGQAAGHARRIARANAGKADLGFAGPRWRDSETLRWVRENPLDGKVYCNEIRILLAMHNRGEAEYANLRAVTDAELRANPAVSASAGQERLEAKLAEVAEGAWVVWFAAPWRDNMVGYGAAWMRVSPSLETVAEFEDGGVWRVARGTRPPAAGGAWRAPGEERIAGGGGFDLYWRGGELVYVKQGCAAADVREKFFLHVRPSNRADLPAERARYGFDNLDFFFVERGIALDGACMAVRPLPEYEIERIETGQYGAGGEKWRAALGAAGIRD